MAVTSTSVISALVRCEIVRRTETTQSEQARSRIVQVSQSMIMLGRLNCTTDIYSNAMSSRVAANLVLGADGSSTLAGSSAGLSFPADRVRFHQLREGFGAILIGGNTAHNEPYGKTPLPLIVLTHRGLPTRLQGNSQAVAWNMPLAQAVQRAESRYGDLLIEAGPVLVKSALAQGLVTDLYLTLSHATGGENLVEATQLVVGADELSREEVEGGLFLHYRLAPSHE